MNDNCYKEIMINYSLIIILCLFVVIYFIINYDIIQQGENIYGGNIPKTIIATGIIFLILYIFVCWEDEIVEVSDIIPIEKYNIINIRENIQELPQQIEKIQITEGKVQNSNIFVAHKNKAKFGIKF
jgi:hypothetical protein